MDFHLLIQPAGYLVSVVLLLKPGLAAAADRHAVLAAVMKITRWLKLQRIRHLARNGV
ncbi:hypothetical protein D3C71_1829700 [compost metagenome]